MVTGPPPLFHGKPILVTYAADLRSARNLAAGVVGTVKYATDKHLTEDELIDRLLAMGEAYRCEIRLIGRTHDVLEFSVTLAERPS